MKILGNRVLVSKVEEPQTGDFKTVEVQDSFIYKGKVEMTHDNQCDCKAGEAVVGTIVLFARNSPDTQDVEHEGKKMKIIRCEDIIAIL